MPIAIYHLSIKIISRGRGKSAVAAAAYRAGEIIKNDYNGIVSDYTRKAGIIDTAILLPPHAPPEYQNRTVLWNAVEKIEKAKNSQLAREITVALPVELTLSQNKQLLHEYVKSNFVDAGMIADVCIHDTGQGNPHAHIMLTMRPITPDGTWGDKQRKIYTLDPDGNKTYDKAKRQYKCTREQTTDWNERYKSEQWRESWATKVNEYLTAHSPSAETIDHRSYKRQGIDQIPTIHLGVSAHQMEQKGIQTNRGNINREIEVSNKLLRQLKGRISKLQKWLHEEQAVSKEPTLVEIVHGILNTKNSNPDFDQWQTIKNLKSASAMLMFLSKHKIQHLGDLDNVIKGMVSDRSALMENLKPVERRLDTLKEHLYWVEVHKTNRPTHKSYQKQAPKKRDAFYEKNRPALTLYESSKKYLDGIMNGNKTLPIGAWEREQKELLQEKQQLTTQYNHLKNEVVQVEQIRRQVERILEQHSPKTHKHQIDNPEL